MEYYNFVLILTFDYGRNAPVEYQHAQARLHFIEAAMAADAAGVETRNRCQFVAELAVAAGWWLKLIARLQQVLGQAGALAAALLSAPPVSVSGDRLVESWFSMELSKKYLEEFVVCDLSLGCRQKRLRINKDKR